MYLAKKLFLLLLCFSLVFLNCRLDLSDKQSENKPKILVGIITEKNVKHEIEAIKNVLSEEYPTFSFVWIQLLGKNNTDIANGISFLIQSGCQYIISPEQSMEKNFLEFSPKYPNIYFIIQSRFEDNSKDNLLIIDSLQTLKTILLEKTKPFQQ